MDGDHELSKGCGCEHRLEESWRDSVEHIFFTKPIEPKVAINLTHLQGLQLCLGTF